MAAINSSSAKVLIGKQSARDQLASSYIRLNWIGGPGLSSNKTVLSQEQFDGEVFSTAIETVGRYTGEGSFTILPDRNAIDLLASGLLGVESTSAGQTVLSTGNPADSESDFYTVYTEVGSGATAIRRRFVNTKITSLKLSATAENQFVEAEVEFLVLNPQAVVDSLPTGATEPSDAVFTFADAEGAYYVAPSATNGEATASINSFELTISREREAFQSDSLAYHTTIDKRGMVELACQLLCEADSLPQLNKIWYGVEDPADGTQPSADIFTDSFEMTLTRGAESIEVLIPKLAYRTDASISPDLQGDAILMPISGRGQKGSSGELLTITTSTDIPEPPPSE